MALTPAEKQRAYRERQRAKQEAGGVTEPVTEAVTEEPAVTNQAVTRPTDLDGLCAAARAGTIVLTETEEQFIRDSLGYSPSEKRGLLERDQAVRRMGARPGPPSLEEYIAEARRGAELHFAQTSPQATASVKTLAETVERAEQYARWRYEGFLAGEIASL